MEENKDGEKERRKEMRNRSNKREKMREMGEEDGGMKNKKEVRRKKISRKWRKRE